MRRFHDRSPCDGRPKRGLRLIHTCRVRHAKRQGMAALHRKTTWLGAALLVGLLAVIASGDPITIFWDDFNSYTPGTNPGTPPIGQPWQIVEVAADSIQVLTDPLGASNRLLSLGRYRNTAILPFSAANQTAIQQAGQATLGFQYRGIANASGYSCFFDVGGYAGNDPAFFLRIQPEEVPGSGGLHDVFYLQPGGGLADTGLNISTTGSQAVSVAADFVNRAYQVTIEGLSATLPMYICPSSISEVRFADYGVAMGSGLVDNVGVTIPGLGGDSEGAGAANPEPASLIMLLTGALALAGAWLAAGRFSRRGT